VTVSIVATASYSAVESSTRLRPTSPAALAASNVTSKIRSGRAEAASRALISTSTVCTNPGNSKSNPPAAYFHRASKENRSTASRSDSPSIRCNTITTDTIIGGTERRPTSANKSANISSGNRLKHSRCSTP